MANHRPTNQVQVLSSEQICILLSCCTDVLHVKDYITGPQYQNDVTYGSSDKGSASEDERRAALAKIHLMDVTRIAAESKTDHDEVSLIFVFVSAAGGSERIQT